MITFRLAFGASALALSSLSASAQAPDAVANEPEPTIILVPVVVSDPALDSGCWAQFYSERDFKGEVATLVGPTQLVSLDKGTARSLRREIDSLVVGPKANLSVYEHAMFREHSVSFDPNSREAGLVKKLGFGGRIESMKLVCLN